MVAIEAFMLSIIIQSAIVLSRFHSVLKMSFVLVKCFLYSFSSYFCICFTTILQALSWWFHKFSCKGVLDSSRKSYFKCYSPCSSQMYFFAWHLHFLSVYEKVKYCFACSMHLANLNQHQETRRSLLSALYSNNVLK